MATDISYRNNEKMEMTAKMDYLGEGPYEVKTQLNYNDIEVSRARYAQYGDNLLIYIETRSPGNHRIEYAGMTVEGAREVARHLNNICDAIEGNASRRR